MNNSNTEIKLLPLKSGNTEIKRRGGKRQGAGRKPLPPERKRVAITFRLKKEKADRLWYLSKRSGKSKTAIIEGLIDQLSLVGEPPRRKPRQKRAGVSIVEYLFAAGRAALDPPVKTCQ